VNIKLYIQVIIISFLMLGGGLSCTAKIETVSAKPEALNGPENASYILANNKILLENGEAEWPAAPGSASKNRVSLFGEIIYGDLNNDESEDAVVFLTYQGGGSGTFFYIAAAPLENGAYQGTNGVWFGDRIGEPTAEIKNGIIAISYLDRLPNEPMTKTPSVKQKKHFVLDRSSLLEIKLAYDDTVHQGWLTTGHEVRSFLPCDEEDELWLAGSSPAQAKIITSYRETMIDSPPYTPVFTVITGKKTAAPKEGFGAEYRGSFSASQLVHIWPQGNCKGDLIFATSPLPGAKISSPLTIKGRARGTWFFEGDFPVILLDEHYNKIAESYVTAKGEWMTEDFVDFEGTLKFKPSVSGQTGLLILRKDNPTGKTKFDDFLGIPVNFN
jgi:hypothetical protein